MKIETLEDGTIVLKEVFNPILLKTEDGNKISIQMRDDGFELRYNDKSYEAKKEHICLFNEGKPMLLVSKELYDKSFNKEFSNDEVTTNKDKLINSLDIDDEIKFIRMATQKIVHIDKEIKLSEEERYIFDYWIRKYENDHLSIFPLSYRYEMDFRDFDKGMIRVQRNTFNNTSNIVLPTNNLSSEKTKEQLEKERYIKNAKDLAETLIDLHHSFLFHI